MSKETTSHSHGDWLGHTSALAIAAATLFYVWGYLVHIVYYRVVGIELIGSPLDYVRSAGDFCIWLVVSLLQLPAAMPRCIRSLGITWSILMLVIAASAGAFAVCQARWPKMTRTLRIVSLILTALGTAAILSQGITVLGPKNVLQPFDPAAIRRLQVSPGGKARSVAVQRLFLRQAYEEYSDYGKGTAGFEYWLKWFNPLATQLTAEARINHYLGVLLMSTIVAAAAGVHVRRAKGEHTHWWVERFVATSALITIAGVLPIVYGCLGRTFSFPVVAIEFDSSAAPSDGSSLPQRLSHPVFLLADTDRDFVVYDRLSFFRIDFVRHDRVKQVNQLFMASPFEACQVELDYFIPCESAWMPKDSIVEGF